MNDVINHPPNYKRNGLEAIDVIESFDLGFHLGNVVKYTLRAGRKGDALMDARKARWYLDRDIRRRQKIEPVADHPRSGGLALADYRLCYLATPYTKYPLGIERAFEHAAALAALLLVLGVRVYSPIAHSHPLAIHGKLDPLDHSIWMPFDEAMMDAADALIVAEMDGWRDSKGVRHEMDFFARDGKPIYMLNVSTLAIEPLSDSIPTREVGSAA